LGFRPVPALCNVTSTTAVLRTALAGRYIIEDEIGHGGSGSVYRARDARLDRPVALKVLSDESENRAELLSRFGREAKILASINSPNIASIYGYEESDGVHLLVLEFVDGITLRERLRRGPLPLAETLTVLGSVAAALKSAHDLGIIHCDLKPENVKITPEGLVKILDFGIARRAGPSPSRRSSISVAAERLLNARHTASTLIGLPDGDASGPTLVEASSASAVAGTPPYMSPEQVANEPIDSRTDIWAFGCLLFESLAGKSPFARRTIPETLLAIVGGEPDWTLLPTATPQRLRDLMRRCLEKDPDRRVRDMLDAQLELKASVLEASRNHSAVLVETPTHNLPAGRVRIVGRRRESEYVAAVLAATRLVTLVGPGGTGKTRLATEVALHLVDEFSSGAWLVDLATGVDSHSLPRTVGQALGLSADSVSDLVRLLRPKRVLLVLDGCERDLPACADLVSQLLSECPLLSIIATGTSALGVAGEAAYEGLPLALPEASKLPPLEELHRMGAVQLFVDCVRSTLPDFTLNEETAPKVVEICRSVSAVPLAIELAVARATTLTLDDLSRSLSEELDPPVLSRPTARNLAGAIRRVIEWACRQLSDADRAVLRRLAVFAGGWTLEAADAVCTSEGVADVLDPLSRLVNAALVSVETRGGQTRYRMPNAVRECAYHQLTQSSDFAVVHRSHCDFFLALAERAESNVSGPEQGVWAARLEADYTNLRAALGWAENGAEVEPRTGLDTKQQQILLRRLSVFENGWTMAAAEEICGGSGVDAVGQLLEHLVDQSLVVRVEQNADVRFEMPARVRRHARKRLLESGEAHVIERMHRTHFLKLAEESDVGLAGADQAVWLRRLEADHANLRAAAKSYRHHKDADASLRLMSALSRFWDIRGHAEEGLELTLRALGDLGAKADPVVTARARSGAARLALRQGDLATAQEQLEKARSLFEKVNDQRAIASALDAQASVLVRRGEFDRARALCERSMRLQRQLDDRQGLAWSLLTFGEAMYRQGDFDASREAREKSLKLFREADDEYGIAWALTGVGKVAFRQGDHALARACYEESLVIHRELGDKAGIAWSLSSLAHVLFAWGDVHGARALLEEGLVLSRQVGNLNGTAWSLCHLGSLAYHEGDLRASTSLLVESLAVFRQLDGGVGSAWCLTVLGNVARRSGKLRRAATLLSESLSVFARFGEKRGTASALRAFGLLAAASEEAERAVRLLSVAMALEGEMGEALAPPEQEEIDARLDELRGVLGEAAFTSARKQGGALSLQEAIDLALSGSARSRRARYRSASAASHSRARVRTS